MKKETAGTTSTIINLLALLYFAFVGLFIRVTYMAGLENNEGDFQTQLWLALGLSFDVFISGRTLTKPQVISLIERGVN